MDSLNGWTLLFLLLHLQFCSPQNCEYSRLVFLKELYSSSKLHENIFWSILRPSCRNRKTKNVFAKFCQKHLNLQDITFCTLGNFTIFFLANPLLWIFSVLSLLFSHEIFCSAKERLDSKPKRTLCRKGVQGASFLNMDF